MSDSQADERPRPKYGEYAPVPPPVVAATPAPAPAPAPAPITEKPRNTRDIVVTTVLLLLGVFDVSTADFAYRLSATYQFLAIDGPSGELAGSLSTLGTVLRWAILAVTIVISLILIARRRRAFWVPLAGYALATVVTGVLAAVILLNDPAYAAWAAQFD